jgi:hypothetical protein
MDPVTSVMLRQRQCVLNAGVTVVMHVFAAASSAATVLGRRFAAAFSTQSHPAHVTSRFMIGLGSQSCMFAVCMQLVMHVLAFASSAATVLGHSFAAAFSMRSHPRTSEMLLDETCCEHCTGCVAVSCVQFFYVQSVQCHAMHLPHARLRVRRPLCATSLVAPARVQGRPSMSVTDMQDSAAGLDEACRPLCALVLSSR